MTRNITAFMARTALSVPRWRSRKRSRVQPLCILRKRPNHFFCAPLPADFQHGPIAMVEGGFPVLAVAPSGKVQESMRDILTHLRRDKDAELVVISDDEAVLALGQSPIQLPLHIPEWLT